MKIIVTAALPYANARLHLGHLRSTYIPSDIYARYLRMKGEEIVFVCATDEHGSPITVTAEKDGVTPKEIADKYHKLAYEDLMKVGCSFDIFSRTTNPAHYEMTRDFFKEIEGKGYIYAKMYEQLYCAKCRRFLPDRYVEGTCPHCEYKEARGDECPNCGRFLKPTELVEPYCISCKSRPEVKETKHWFFKLSAFESFLKEWLEGNERLPKIVKTYALSWIREGLKDWCISRDLSWGVQLPIEPSEGKVLYVWFDAPIGYISSTKDWAEKIGKPDYWKEFWQSEESEIIHFIGKGIIYHHALFWPAILKAKGDMRLPTLIVAGGHYTLEGKIMSKSKGWVVEVADYLKKFDPDLLRYYLMAASPLDKDADFSWRDFAERCNSELNDILGNFIHRVLTFVYRNYGGVPTPDRLDEYDRKILSEVEVTHENVKRTIEEFDFRSALHLILSMSAMGNKYLNDKEPWKVIAIEPKKAATTMYVCSQVLKAMAVWLAPFLPNTAEKLWKILNLEGNIHEKSFDEALKPIPAGYKIGEPRPLFKKIEKEEVEEQEALLRKGLMT